MVSRAKNRNLRHRILLLWSWIVWSFTFFLPDAPSIMRLRGYLYGLAMRSKGRNLQVATNVILNGLEYISVGDDVYFAPGVVVLAGLSIEFENGVLVGFHSVVTDGNHSRLNGSFRFGIRDNKPIRIGEGTWIGANATVISGVSIGRGCIVGANSIVTRSVSDNCLLAGVPASTIRKIEDIEI